MNLKQLKYFMAISEEHRITAAAKKLHIAQPPLSCQISQLENELGVTLLRHGPRGVELTLANRKIGCQQLLTCLAAVWAKKRRLSPLAQKFAELLGA